MPVAALVLWSTAATADSSWTLRGQALGWFPGGEEVRAMRHPDPPLMSERTRFGVSDGSGLGLDLEYRPKARLGIEVASLFGELDSAFHLDTDELALADEGSIGVEAFTAGINVHWTRGKRVDLFAGAFAAILFFDDIIFLREAGRREKLAFDDDTGLGLRLGIDVPFQPGSAWMFSAGVRYFDAIMESEVAGQDLDAAPLVPSIGIGYRF